MNRNKYSTKVFYNNGNVKTIKIEMDCELARKTYKKAKEEYLKDKNVSSVELHIISPNGGVNPYYVKPNKNNKKDKFIRENINSDVRSIASDILIRCELLLHMKTYHHDKLSECDRKRSEFLHMIAATKNKEFNSEESKQKYKIDIFDGLEQNEEQRRLSKNNFSDLQTMFCDTKLEDMIRSISKWSKARKGYKETPEEFKDKVRKIKTYTTDNERLKYIRKYEKLYDEVEWYKNDKILIFIGHVGEGKRKYKKRPFKVIKKDFL